MSASVSTYACTLQDCLGGSTSPVAGVGLAYKEEIKSAHPQTESNSSDVFRAKSNSNYFPPLHMPPPQPLHLSLFNSFFFFLSFFCWGKTHDTAGSNVACSCCNVCDSVMCEDAGDRKKKPFSLPSHTCDSKFDGCAKLTGNKTK